jgi:hypothetical protein
MDCPAVLFRECFSQRPQTCLRRHRQRTAPALLRYDQGARGMSGFRLIRISPKRPTCGAKLPFLHRAKALDLNSLKISGAPEEIRLLTLGVIAARWLYSTAATKPKLASHWVWVKTVALSRYHLIFSQCSLLGLGRPETPQNSRPFDRKLWSGCGGESDLFVLCWPILSKAEECAFLLPSFCSPNLQGFSVPRLEWFAARPLCGAHRSKPTGDQLVSRFGLGAGLRCRTSNV